MAWYDEVFRTKTRTESSVEGVDLTKYRTTYKHLTIVDDRRRSTRVQERRMTVGVSVQYDLHVDNSE